MEAAREAAKTGREVRRHQDFGFSPAMTGTFFATAAAVFGTTTVSSPKSCEHRADAAPLAVKAIELPRRQGSLAPGADAAT
jgi:hypothetical protein